MKWTVMTDSAPTGVIGAQRPGTALRALRERPAPVHAETILGRPRAIDFASGPSL